MTNAKGSATAELAYLTRAQKAPSLHAAVERLAEGARSESWTHEEFLVACLQREVAARESHGGEARIRAARFPTRKTLEDFDYNHQRSVRRDLIAHLGTLDFVTARENVVFAYVKRKGTQHDVVKRDRRRPTGGPSWKRRRGLCAGSSPLACCGAIADVALVVLPLF